MKRGVLASGIGLFVVATGCSSSTTTQNNVTVVVDAGTTGGSSAAGNSSTGGNAATGGSKATSGAVNTGGANATGGAASTGGSKSTSTGGAVTTGGLASAGGAVTIGGTLGNGGSISTGGLVATGGAVTAGGTASATGGSKATGGAPATGGVAATGGIAATGGTTSKCSIPGATSSLKVTNGWVQAGSWNGYAFAYVSTSSPSGSVICNGNTTCFSSVNAAPLCVDGSLAADSTYATVGGLGVILNQAEGSSTVGVVVLGGTALYLDYKNCGGSVLRAQVSTSDGMNNWCYTLPAAGPITIPWTAFTTACWDSTNPGTHFDPATQIVSVHLVVPSNTVAVPFSICLNDIAQK